MFSESTVNVLFQGDSITDAGRSRENDVAIGAGYPAFVSGIMGYQQPGKYAFINRRISGNRVVDIYARIKIDFINLKPDVISIMNGVNDVWHELGNKNGVDAEKYERVYDMLLSEIKTALPNVKFMILEPYVLKAAATQENWQYFDTEVKLRAAASKRLAEKYNAVFIPLQKILDDACEKMPAEYWSADGVHPTREGHALIADEWMKAFQTL